MANGINITEEDDGTVVFVQPDMNAVMVQFVLDRQDDGTVEYHRVVSIMCKDKAMLPKLREDAHRILARADLSHQEIRDLGEFVAERKGKE